jgi:sortase A
MKEKKSRFSFRRILVIAGFAVIVLIGINVLFYPQLSNYINAKNGSRVIASYNDAVAQLDDTDYSAYLKAAQEYNTRLASKHASVQDAFSVGEGDENHAGEYWSLLDVDGDGVMGYIEIKEINISLPIYHGTDDAVLAAGAGHLQGSSLPVGGENTHTVISAHTGLPSAEYFTDIDQLKTGDTFVLHVLNETLTYQVDQILTVLPDEVDALGIVSGGDYATLVTCTPYGINDHRLLVRGKRIANLPEDSDSQQGQTNEETQNWFQKITQKVFAAFASAFEAVITFFVKVSGWIMGRFGIEH